MHFKQTVKTKLLQTWLEVYINLRRVTSLEVTWQRMQIVICLQIPIFEYVEELFQSAIECTWINAVRQIKIYIA
jgi:hypothetical protein